MANKSELFILHKLASWGIYYSDDKVLINYLSNYFNIKIINWLITDINKLKNKVILIRYPENYLKESNKFLSWLNKLEKIAKKVINPYKLIKHNVSKQYLFEIEEQEINIVPSIILKSYKDWEKIKWEEIILKPLIGESGMDVIKLNKNKDFPVFKKYMNNYRSCLAQKFLPEIFEGEISCIFINGRYTHSVCKKTPSKRDFKTHWKLYKQYGDKDILINNGLKILKLYGSDIYYSRMDWIKNEKKWYLSEVDLIDPVFYISKLDPKLKADFLKSFRKMLNTFYE